jgi:hypothetical protein
VGDDVVRMAHNAVVSHDLATGEENWSLPFQLSEGIETCQASPTPSENRIALLQGRDCEVLTVVDIAAGEEVMSMPLHTDDGITPGGEDFPAILGDTVAVGWGTGGAGYSISERRQLWESTTLGEEDCPEIAYAVFGDLFVSQTNCGTFGEEGGSIRATTEGGEEVWEWKHDGQLRGQPMQVDSVISIDPLVVYVTRGDPLAGEQTHHFLAIDEDHERVAQELDWSRDRYYDPCDINTFTNCPIAVVHAGFLYAPSTPVDGQNAVVAFDLATGRAVYEVDPVSGGQIWPFGVQGGEILAYQPSDYDVEGLVVAIDPAKERARPVMALDRSAREAEFTMVGTTFDHNSVPVWHQPSKTFLLVNQKFYPGSQGEPAMLVYH